MPNDADRLRLLRDFSAAWARRDADGVLALMTGDCVYAASVGPEPGTTYRGHEAVRRGLIEMFAHDAGSRSEVSNIFINGDRAAWEWSYFFPDGNGGERVVRGCDFFTFEGDRISRKDAFRKTTS